MTADEIRGQLADALQMWDSDRANVIAGIVAPTVHRIVAEELRALRDWAWDDEPFVIELCAEIDSRADALDPEAVQP